MKKQLTIAMTDRAPVSIREDDWPVVASARGDSYAGHDYNRHQQALARREIDAYSLRVRRHPDGRALVYAALTGATAWTGTEDYRAGALLDAGADVAAAIREVGQEAGLPDRLIRECIADLPGEVL